MSTPAIYLAWLALALGFAILSGCSTPVAFYRCLPDDIRSTTGTSGIGYSLCWRD